MSTLNVSYFISRAYATSYRSQNNVNIVRSVARNLLRETKEEKRRSGGRKSPSGVQRQSPGGVWRLAAKPQKPETHAEHSTEQNT